MRYVLCLLILCVIASTVFGDDVISARRQRTRMKFKSINDACLYQKGEWRNFNQGTQIMTRTLTLKRGDPDRCEATKEISLSCKKVVRRLRKKACQYSKGDLSDCDLITNEHGRTFKLRLREASECGTTKSILRKCKKFKRQQQRKKLAASKAAKGCKYQLGEWRDCDEKTNTRSRTLTLRSGDVQLCQPNKIFYRKCKKSCKYNKGQWSECDMEKHLMERLDTLRSVNSDFCEPSRKITKKCGKQKQNGRKAKARCKYQLGEWRDCDEKTNTRSRTLTLRSGDVQLCQPNKIFYRKCKKSCKYNKGQWSECDMEKHLMERLDMLTSVNSDFCEPSRKITKKCGKQKQNNRKSKATCKYNKGQWSECDIETNLKERLDTLTSVNSDFCEPTRKITKKCGKQKQNGGGRTRATCKYNKGQWSECDIETNLKERLDTLTSVNDNFCEPSRKITKKCGKQKQNDRGRTRARCKYQIGNWSDCDPDTNLRSRVKQLVSGDPVQCQEEKLFTKSCARPNGKERCFFGDWGDYEPCQNGVMKSHRTVLQGGIECQRRGVKTKPCDNDNNGIALAKR